jgi:SAM-dependent methyltransferase
MSAKSAGFIEGKEPGECRLCGGAGEPWLVKAGFPIQRCRSCDNRFLPESVIPDDLEGLYAREYFEGRGSTGYPGYLADAVLLERNFSERLAWIESFRRPGRLLEIGAAYGLFLKVARARGWEVVGVELVADCAAEATRIAGAPVLAGDFLQTQLPGRFDVIAFLDVIEHMRDPIACMRRARELLAPGGCIVIETGDAASRWARLLGRRWYFLDPPQHLFYFTAAGLERSLRSCGFTGEKRILRPGRRVSLANIAFKLVRGTSWDRVTRLVAGVARAGIPAGLYLNFGDGVLMAVCRDDLSEDAS